MRHAIHLLTMSLLALTCVAAADSLSMPPMSAESVSSVIARMGDDVRAIPGVTGIAEGRCEQRPCIKVYVTMLSSDFAQLIPAELGGYPVTIEEIGDVKKQPQP